MSPSCADYLRMNTSIDPSRLSVLQAHDARCRAAVKTAQRRVDEANEELLTAKELARIADANLSSARRYAARSNIKIEAAE